MNHPTHTPVPSSRSKCTHTTHLLDARDSPIRRAARTSTDLNMNVCMQCYAAVAWPARTFVIANVHAIERVWFAREHAWVRWCARRQRRRANALRVKKKKRLPQRTTAQRTGFRPHAACRLPRQSKWHGTHPSGRATEMCNKHTGLYSRGVRAMAYIFCANCLCVCAPGNLFTVAGNYNT